MDFWHQGPSVRQIFKQVFILTNQNSQLQPHRGAQTQIGLIGYLKQTACDELFHPCVLRFFFYLGILLFFFNAAHVSCIFVPKGRRTLGLLVENCGRVNYGTTLDEQRKGTSSLQTDS